jgi:hypothetical protein
LPDSTDEFLVEACVGGGEGRWTRGEGVGRRARSGKRSHGLTVEAGDARDESLFRGIVDETAVRLRDEEDGRDDGSIDRLRRKRRILGRDGRGRGVEETPELVVRRVCM